MAIYKMSGQFLKAVSNKTLTDSFADAWGLVVNILQGAWGTLEYKVTDPTDSNDIPNVTVKASYRGDHFSVSWTTTKSGSMKLYLPTECIGYSQVNVKTYSGNVATVVSDYIIDEGITNITVTLPVGTNIVTITGTSRRIS